MQDSTGRNPSSAQGELALIVAGRAPSLATVANQNRSESTTEEPTSDQDIKGHHTGPTKPRLPQKNRGQATTRSMNYRPESWPCHQKTKEDCSKATEPRLTKQKSRIFKRPYLCSL